MECNAVAASLSKKQKMTSQSLPTHSLDDKSSEMFISRSDVNLSFSEPNRHDLEIGNLNTQEDIVYDEFFQTVELDEKKELQTHLNEST